MKPAPVPQSADRFQDQGWEMVKSLQIYKGPPCLKIYARPIARLSKVSAANWPLHCAAYSKPVTNCRPWSYLNLCQWTKWMRVTLIPATVCLIQQRLAYNQNDSGY